MINDRPRTDHVPEMVVSVSIQRKYSPTAGFFPKYTRDFQLLMCRQHSTKLTAVWIINLTKCCLHRTIDFTVLLRNFWQSKEQSCDCGPCVLKATDDTNRHMDKLIYKGVMVQHKPKQNRVDFWSIIPRHTPSVKSVLFGLHFINAEDLLYLHILY